MLKRLDKFFVPSLLIAFVFAYLPALHGEAIWDDLSYWFKHPLLDPNFSYSLIWGKFAWPMTVTMQKVLFSVFGHWFTGYHIFNIVLHLFNSVLVYRIVRELRLPYPRMIFGLFLLHPASVISVAWMIQMKTLLSFFLAAAAVLLFLKCDQGRRYSVASWVCFLLSVLSKSSTLPLTAFFLLLGTQRLKGLKRIVLIPFLLICIFGTTKLLQSSVVTNSPQPSQDLKLLNQDYMNLQEAGPVLRKIPAHALEHLHYYFWQSLVPVNNVPVKNEFAPPQSWIHWLNLVFIVLLLIITWKRQAFFPLVLGLIMLTPYLGFIQAPFMLVTWVSDQHLYVAIPFFLATFLMLFERWSWRYKLALPALLIGSYFLKSYQASHFYVDEKAFFESSYQNSPTNVPVVFNLAMNLIQHRDFESADHLLSESLELAKYEPQMRQSDFFPHLGVILLQLQSLKESKP